MKWQFSDKIIVMFKTLKTVMRNHSSIRSHQMHLVNRHADPQRTQQSLMVFTKYFHSLPVFQAPGRVVLPERGRMALSDQLVVSKYNSLQNQSIHLLVQSPSSRAASRAASLWESSQEPVTWLDCEVNKHFQVQVWTVSKALLQMLK